MLRRLLIVAIVGLGIVAGPMNAPQRALADQRDFTLVNDSGRVITHVYVSPSKDREWGDDILGRDVLQPGESVFIYFSRYDAGSCFYDIRVVGSNGAEEGILTGVNLCTTDTVTFS